MNTNSGVLLWEFSTACVDLPGQQGLRSEGVAIVRALVADLLAADSGYNGTVGLAWNNACGDAPAGCNIYAVNNPWHLLEQQFGRYDFFWPIFPENWKHGVELVAHAVSIGYKLCCSRPDAIALAADKLACLRHIASFNLDTAPSWQISESVVADAGGPWIRKPRCSVSGHGCRLFQSLSEARAASGSVDDLLQPYIAGQSCSLVMVCNYPDSIVLAANTQKAFFTAAGSELQAITVNSIPLDEVSELAATVAKAIPGLHGFIGIDFIRTAAGRLIVLEVNPRLTSSYPGLRAALAANPLCWMVPLFSSANMPTMPEQSSIQIEVIIK